MPVRLFVGNLPYDTTEPDLREFFAPVGPLSTVIIPVDRETGKRRGFAFVEFSDPAHAETYGTVTVKLDFQRFASVKPEFAGEPIRYGATIPTNAREPEAAALLLAFLLGPEGQRIMAENSQPVITPPIADHLDAVPEPVKALCVSGD